MSTHDGPWPAGTPCWFELSAREASTARDFYAALLGWELDVSGPEFGHYGIGLVEGRRAAGVGSTSDPTAPTAWATYLASDDVDATAAAVLEAGGQVISPAMDVGAIGRMFEAVDPTGARFAVWQAGTTTGAEIVNQPGGVVWAEQVSADFEAAKSFYRSVFGLQANAVPGLSEGTPAAMLSRAGGPVVASMSGHGAASVPSDGESPYWLVYFAVVDTDAASAQATQLGGSVVVPAFDAPFGRTALLAGPEGERFGVVQTPTEGHPHSDPS